MKRIIGLMGIGLLVAGVFSPVTRIPGGASTTFFDNGIVDSGLLICLAILSGIFLLAQNFRALLFTGMGSLAIAGNMLAYILTQFMGTHSAYAGGLVPGAGGPGPVGPELQWGWAILFAGTIFIVACPLVRERARNR